MPSSPHFVRPEDDAEQPPFREAGPPDERKRIGAGELVEDREVLDDVGRPGCRRDKRDARVKRESGRTPQPNVGGDEDEIHERLVVELLADARPDLAESGLDVVRRAHRYGQRDPANPARHLDPSLGGEGGGRPRRDDDREDEQDVGSPSHAWTS